MEFLISQIQVKVINPCNSHLEFIKLVIIRVIRGKILTHTVRGRTLIFYGKVPKLMAGGL
jgi:hypothetical protein